MTQLLLSGINVYPVKSLAGISANSWPVTEKGFQYDRKWMVIDNERQFLSQRKLPKMALIKTAIIDKNLVLSAPDRENLSLPLEPDDGHIINSTIWHDQCDARSVSAEADQWLSDFLNQDCRLVYQPDEVVRPVDPRYAQPTDKVAFSDGFPFLIIAENSLAALNHDMQLNLPMARFRPNLVISGCPSYAEDSWREISIGAIGFRLTKPCARCSVPTIDPETAQTGKEPLTTLNRTRKWQGKVYFGQNALHNQCGRLAVGDAVKIKSTGAKQPPI
ncbi:MAG: MOSC domain-containing protein [Methylobacter sp.]|nr:MOSC domain-containing protein [Methylobacter sp.]MDP2100632.1 MOSC domain-containing protein [Methylobacter sp.]MDP2426587.1 MOSC domain-containing protein [Methylobacter sp.]MDP3056583.1 MOSC domain-containing protein [Methylobacter sp.]MDP3360964.1 MOSC domain-containing protein [Methylobacter sp.]